MTRPCKDDDGDEEAALLCEQEEFLTLHQSGAFQPAARAIRVSQPQPSPTADQSMPGKSPNLNGPSNAVFLSEAVHERSIRPINGSGHAKKAASHSKRSIFAQRRRAMATDAVVPPELSPFPKTFLIDKTATGEAVPSSSSVYSFTVASSTLPAATTTSPDPSTLDCSVWKNINEENIRKLETMSDRDRKDALTEIESVLSPESLTILRDRALHRKLAKSDDLTRKASDAQINGPCVTTTTVDELDDKQSEELWSDHTGILFTKSLDGDEHFGLRKLGLWCRSKLTTQRNISLQILTRIISRWKEKFYSPELTRRLERNLSDGLIAFSLRFVLDDRNETTQAFAIDAIHAWIVLDDLENAISPSLTSNIVVSWEQESAAMARLELEDDYSYHQRLISSKEPALGFVATDTVKRLTYLLQHSGFATTTVVKALDLILSMLLVGGAESDVLSALHKILQQPRDTLDEMHCIHDRVMRIINFYCLYSKKWAKAILDDSFWLNFVTSISTSVSLEPTEACVRAFFIYNIWTAYGIVNWLGDSLDQWTEANYQMLMSLVQSTGSTLPYAQNSLVLLLRTFERIIETVSIDGLVKEAGPWTRYVASLLDCVSSTWSNVVSGCSSVDVFAAAIDLGTAVMRHEKLPAWITVPPLPDIRLRYQIRDVITLLSSLLDRDLSSAKNGERLDCFDFAKEILKAIPQTSPLFGLVYHKMIRLCPRPVESYHYAWMVLECVQFNDASVIRDLLLQHIFNRSKLESIGFDDGEALEIHKGLLHPCMSVLVDPADIEDSFSYLHIHFNRLGASLKQQLNFPSTLFTKKTQSSSSWLFSIVSRLPSTPVMSKVVRVWLKFVHHMEIKTTLLNDHGNVVLKWKSLMELYLRANTEDIQSSLVDNLLDKYNDDILQHLAFTQPILQDAAFFRLYNAFLDLFASSSFGDKTQARLILPFLATKIVPIDYVVSFWRTCSEVVSLLDIPFPSFPGSLEEYANCKAVSLHEKEMLDSVRCFCRQGLENDSLVAGSGLFVIANEMIKI